MSAKSLICPFEGNEGEFERAINEVDTFAKIQNLDSASTDRLRLLSEEVMGMAANVLNIDSGRFWLEKEDDEFSINFACNADIGERAKAIFDSAASNTEYKGISGLFRKVYDKIEDAFSVTAGCMPESELAASGIYGSGLEMVEPDIYEWSLEKYVEKCDLDEKAERWDELELSVIRKMSKDVVISYRNKKISLTVYPKF